MPKGGKTGKTGKSHRQGYTSKGLQDFPALGASGKMGKVRGKRRQYYWLTFPAFPFSFLVGIRANPLLSRLTACHFPTFPTFPLFKNIYKLLHGYRCHMNRSNNVTADEYCKDLLQKVIGWQEQNKQARLLDAQAVNTSDYAKREALIKVAEVKIYTAKQTGDCISEYMG